MVWILAINTQKKSRLINNKLKISAKFWRHWTGVVTYIGDGIARAHGWQCHEWWVVDFENGSYGMAQNLESTDVGIIILGWFWIFVKVIQSVVLVKSWKYLLGCFDWAGCWSTWSSSWWTSESQDRQDPSSWNTSSWCYANGNLYQNLFKRGWKRLMLWYQLSWSTGIDYRRSSNW